MTINKKDIRNLPLARLYQEISEKTSIALEEEQELLKESALRKHKAKVESLARNMRAYTYSEAGSDGDEESIEESISFVEPVLSAEISNTIRDNVRSELAVAFIKAYDLNNGKKDTLKWVSEQMQGVFGNWTPTRNANNKVDPIATLKANVKDDWTKGLGILATIPRTEFLRDCGVTQYSLKTYGPLTPMIMSGLKIYQNIKYSEWARVPEIKYVSDPMLAEAMLVEDKPEWLTKENLLQWRLEGTTVATGKTAGKTKNPATTATLTNIKHTELSELPRLAQVMLTQIWCAHPTNRTEFMILDPWDWDLVPMSLVSAEVLPGHSTRVPFAKPVSANPWD